MRSEVNKVCDKLSDLTFNYFYNRNEIDLDKLNELFKVLIAHSIQILRLRFELLDNMYDENEIKQKIVNKLNEAIIMALRMNKDN